MKHTRKNKKGGFFFSKNDYVAPSTECDPNNLASISGSNALHENYQKCCPKGIFGTKNSSPYCKQVDLNFQSALKGGRMKLMNIRDLVLKKITK